MLVPQAYARLTLLSAGTTGNGQVQPPECWYHRPMPLCLTQTGLSTSFISTQFYFGLSSFEPHSQAQGPLITAKTQGPELGLAPGRFDADVLPSFSLDFVFYVKSDPLDGGA